MKLKTLNYNVIIKTEKEGGFTVMVPSLPGCVTYGKNLQTAKKMAKEAIQAYVASLIKHQEEVPLDDTSYVTNVNFEMPVILGKKIKYA